MLPGMARTTQQRRTHSSIGAHESWARTPDRTARTTAARSAGPAELSWHLARLDPERFADATDAQREAAAASARKAYFAKLALAPAKARRGRTPKDDRGTAGR